MVLSDKMAPGGGASQVVAIRGMMRTVVAIAYTSVAIQAFGVSESRYLQKGDKEIVNVKRSEDPEQPQYDDAERERQVTYSSKDL